MPAAVASVIVEAGESSIAGKSDKSVFSNISIKKKVLQNLPIGSVGSPPLLLLFVVGYVLVHWYFTFSLIYLWGA